MTPYYPQSVSRSIPFFLVRREFPADLAVCTFSPSFLVSRVRAEIGRGHGFWGSISVFPVVLQ